MDIQKENVGFGDYCSIEQKRYGAPNEFYGYKVVGRLRSNSWVDTPVDAQDSKPKLHNEIADVVQVISCTAGCDVVEQFRVSDLKRAWQQAQKVAVPEYCEIYLGMGLFVMCDWLDFEKIKNYRWNATSRKEFTQWSWAYDTSCKTRKKVAMHNLIMNPSDGLFVDHINGNGLDNRRSNLRIVTKQQNCFNSRSKGGSSIYKGVSFDKQSNSWKAYISKDGKRTTLGRFGTEVEAAIAYDTKAKILFGEYAKLNFIDNKAMIEAQEN